MITDDHPEDLRVQVVYVDHYISKPMPPCSLPSLNQSPAYKFADEVPVIRIFGSTPPGQKTMVHIHGVFPYFYFRSDGDEIFDDVDELTKFLPQIAEDLNVLMRKDAEIEGRESKKKRKNIIAKLVVVRGIPFYGYHSESRLFVQIFLYNPRDISLVVQLLGSGLVAGRKYQSFEAHIPYLLQFFVDYNIAGMSYIRLSHTMFRAPLPDSFESVKLDAPGFRIWHRQNIDPSKILGYASSCSQGHSFRGPRQWYDRESTCELELDVVASSVLNRISRPTSDSSGAVSRHIPSLMEILKNIVQADEKYPKPFADATARASSQLLKSSSSLLSQSVFFSRMHESIDEILQKAMFGLSPVHEAALSIEQTLIPKGGLNFDEISQYEFSQATRATDSNPGLDDENVISALMMMKNSFPVDPAKATLTDEWKGTIHDDEFDDGVDAVQEIDNIIATQQEFEYSVKSRKSQDLNWWETVDAVPAVELGSSRKTPSMHAICYQNRTFRSHVQDIEDLIPPQPTFCRSEQKTLTGTLGISGEKGARRILMFGMCPPSRDDVGEDKQHCSGKRIQGKQFDLAFNGRRLQQFDSKYSIKDPTAKSSKVQSDRCHFNKNARVRTPARLPPLPAVVYHWIERQEKTSGFFGEDHVRLNNQRHDDTGSLNAQQDHEFSNLTLFSLEIHANSKQNRLPDPRRDSVSAICYEIQDRILGHKRSIRGAILLNEVNGTFSLLNDSCIEIRIAKSEDEIFHELVQLVLKWDPDILVGYDVQKWSWGYLFDRADSIKINLLQKLSRLPHTKPDTRNAPNDQANDNLIGTEWGRRKASGIWVHGRHVLNLWRMMRSEIKLPKYAFEEVVKSVLKRETPVFSTMDLTCWFLAGSFERDKVIKYYVERASLNLKILFKMQLLTRTSEMSRLFGIDFYSVLSRGSQYRVEAVMLRVTKEMNYILVSPTQAQVASQAPMECIPLVMEPLSGYYVDPVVVLDFQSLYPSLIIAYNFCYSTILGRLRNGIDPELESELGVIPFTPTAAVLKECRKDLLVAPNGSLFCSKVFRRGVLPIILDEILSARILLKGHMHAAKARGERKQHKVLDARQLALKMIANVTYGYTAAGFSGRMPCAQLADAIVQSGRCTLEAAIRLVESNASWNAKVIYGDTDSLFVLLKGRSRREAFQIGNEIADVVTAANPRPITLKLEKVYHGCVLVSKKRYVGNKFENEMQTEGELDCKGIEIVRRDSCGVVQHALKSSLRLLFVTNEIYNVKQFLQWYWMQMLTDKLLLKDFIFAKEVRMGTYSERRVPPAALVSAKEMAYDPRAEPAFAERVPYIVVNGAPGSRLMDLVVSPREFISGKSEYAINYSYYIHKQIIPSLERIFLMMGVNIRRWYTEVPRLMIKARRRTDCSYDFLSFHKPLETIDSYYSSAHCDLCGNFGMDRLCDTCHSETQRSTFNVAINSLKKGKDLNTLALICKVCGGQNAVSSCRNTSCIVWNVLHSLGLGSTLNKLNMDESPSPSTRYDKLIHQIVQLNTDLQKTAALTQTLKTERDALQQTNEKLKDESRRLHERCEKLQKIVVQETEEKIQTHKRHEEIIAKWKSQIEQKAKAFENLQKKLAPPRDLEQLRLQIQEELDVPHQHKLKMFQEEVEKHRQSTFNLRRQFECLKSEYEQYAIDQGNEMECLHASYNEKLGALKTKLVLAEERVLNSSKAETVRKLQQNLEGAQVEIKMLQDEIKEVRDEKNRLVKQSSDESTNIALSLSEEKSRCVVLELENKRLIRNLDVQAGEVETLNTKAIEMHAKLDQLTLECENLREQLKQRDQLLFDSHSTVSSRLKDEREAWKKEQEQYQERIQELSSRLAIKEQIISGDKDGQTTKSTVESNELAKIVQERQREIEKYQSQVGEAYRKVTEKEDMIRRLQSQHDDVVAQLKSENSTIQLAAQTNLAEKERAIVKQQTLQELVNRMKSESLSMRTKFKDLENEYRVLQLKQREIIQANDELRLEIDARNCSIKFLEQDVSNVTASLQLEKEAHYDVIETMKHEYKRRESDFRKEQNILKVELKSTLIRLGRELSKARKKRDAYKKKCIEVHERLKKTMNENEIMESKFLSMKQEHISEAQQLISKFSELEMEKASTSCV